MSNSEASGTDKGKERSEVQRFHPSEPLDAELRREIDEALGGASLEELMEAEDLARSPDGPREEPAAEGVRRGRVIAIQGDDIFVELGPKSQGFLPAQQFADEPLPEIGSEIEVTIEGYDEADGLLILSRQGAVRAATWETLQEGQTVEGRVTGHNKGGLELTINGIRAFMPISQIERFRVTELNDYVDQRLQCQVVEIDPREENVIVSRRALLELEAERQAEELWAVLAEDQTICGVVRSIVPYGAFIDLGGVDGLLHVSDMSHSRVEDPRTVVQEGQRIEVMVLKVERDPRRISLGLKQILPDPWAEASGKWKLDEIVTGRVSHLADFGAFVELEAGVEGLIPISELSYQRVRHPSQIVQPGQTVKVRVIGMDTANKRMGLSLKRTEDDPWMGASVRWPEGSVAEGRVTRLTDFGAFVELTPGVEGLVHISELGSGFVRHAGTVVQEGQAVRLKVLSVDEEARRMSLSIKQLAKATQVGGATAETEPPKPQGKRKKPLKGGLE